MRRNPLVATMTCVNIRSSIIRSVLKNAEPCHSNTEISKCQRRAGRRAGLLDFGEDGENSRGSWARRLASIPRIPHDPFSFRVCGAQWTEELCHDACSMNEADLADLGKMVRKTRTMRRMIGPLSVFNRRDRRCGRPMRAFDERDFDPPSPTPTGRQCGVKFSRAVRMAHQCRKLRS